MRAGLAQQRPSRRRIDFGIGLRTSWCGKRGRRRELELLAGRVDRFYAPSPGASILLNMDESTAVAEQSQSRQAGCPRLESLTTILMAKFPFCPLRCSQCRRLRLKRNRGYLVEWARQCTVHRCGLIMRAEKSPHTRFDNSCPPFAHSRTRYAFEWGFIVVPKCKMCPLAYQSSKSNGWN